MIALYWNQIAWRTLASLVGLSGLLLACALPHHEPPYEDAAYTRSPPAAESHQPPAWSPPLGHFPVVVRTEGYGVLLPREDLTPIQQRLLAMQASRMDAYRAMTERVHGLYLQSVTSMDQQVLSEDQLRGWFDHLLLGARIIAVREVSEGLFETQIELLIDPQQGIIFD